MCWSVANDVLINPHGERRRNVAELVGDDLRACAGEKAQARGRVPKIVQADPLQPGLDEHRRLPATVQVASRMTVPRFAGRSRSLGFGSLLVSASRCRARSALTVTAPIATVLQRDSHHRDAAARRRSVRARSRVSIHASGSTCGEFDSYPDFASRDREISRSCDPGGR